MLKKSHKEESERHYAVPKTVSFLQLIKCTAAVKGFRISFPALVQSL